MMTRRSLLRVTCCARKLREGGFRHLVFGVQDSGHCAGTIWSLIVKAKKSAHHLEKPRIRTEPQPNQM